MTILPDDTPKIEMRSPDQVMRLKRMGSMHQSRLSFMRVLLRRAVRENWQFERTRFELDDTGVGVAIYQVKGPDRTYSLIAFAHDLPDDLRSDRVIAEAWDATFALFDGVPTNDDVERLAKNVPLQEAGRVSAKELVLSRANRSERLWNAVVDCLSRGEQPDLQAVETVGYLMRTTAVYGSGKFGACDRSKLIDREECRPPFQLEMLAVYLIRWFVVDLVEHHARMKGGDKAIGLDTSIARKIGIGNSTGLGMAPFLVNHPALLHQWAKGREEALLRVRSLPQASTDEQNIFLDYLRRFEINLGQWKSGHPYQQDKCSALQNDLDQIAGFLKKTGLDGAYPWDELYCFGEENLSLEGQEALVSLMFEPYGDLIDPLAESLWIDETKFFQIDGTQTVSEILADLNAVYGWAEDLDFSVAHHQSRFWYTSEAKLEPRLGERFEEEGSELEQPLAIARDVMAFRQVLIDEDDDKILAEVMLLHPEFRNVARRLQLAKQLPFAEIRDNLIAADMMPIDMLRFKLSFFGTTKFDPRSDRWVRVCMYQNAPFPAELQDIGDDWAYPSHIGE